MKIMKREIERVGRAGMRRVALFKIEGAGAWREP